MNHFDFQDPYLVDGGERAKRFAHNFNAQRSFGPSGFAEQCKIVREADRSLLPKHLNIFCAKIRHERSSLIFKALRVLGDRYHQWEVRFGPAYLDSAMLETVVNRHTSFQGENLMQMDANELREGIVGFFLGLWQFQTLIFGSYRYHRPS